MAYGAAALTVFLTVFCGFQHLGGGTLSIDAVTLTRADVAWLVGMSDSWVRDRMQAGDLPRPGSTAEEYVEAFVAYRVRKFEAAEADGTLNKEQEQARLAKEQADAKGMDNAERRRELASLPDMVAAGAGVIVMIVAQLQQVGARVAKGDTKLRTRIDAEINNVLTDLSMTRIEEARGGGFDDGEPEEEGGA
ncbi:MULTISPECIES: terminase [unclassified Sphingomonas]|uniref:terminase n=1 Tax=unclassified Sphingomonas TaxID=196159 RepID=UPI002269FC9F|nr:MULTISPECIES: terminase [unclassified Sphingomonas]